MTFSPRATTPISWRHETPPCYKFDLISDSLLKFPSFRQFDRQQNTGQTSSSGYDHPAARITKFTSQSLSVNKTLPKA